MADNWDEWSLEDGSGNRHIDDENATSNIPVPGNSSHAGEPQKKSRALPWTIAADVNARDEEALIRKCWTFPPSYISEVYLGDSARLANLMTQAPGMSQSGPAWTNGAQSDIASLTGGEAESAYACPNISFVEGDAVTTDESVYVREDVLMYRAERYIRREQGNPVNPGDADADHGLRCGIDPGPVTGVAAADPDDIEVVSYDGSIWILRAGEATATMWNEPGHLCIKSLT